MISWSVNYLFLANAALLLLLALFLINRNKAAISWIFFITSVSLALWNICVFLLEQRLLTESVATIVKVQMIAVMVFANGLFYFSSSYPVYQSGGKYWLGAVPFTLFALALVFTNFVTHAEYVDSNIVYEDGIGYRFFTLYISLLSFSALYKLIMAWRKFPDYRSRIRYFFVGITIFVISAITCNMLLPSLGNYDYLIVGRLSATFAPGFFFYAMTKHEFLDMTVIINRGAAWLGALAIMLGAAVMLHQLTVAMPLLNILALCVAVVLAAFYAQPLQQFLLTTAKRKFIRGWYSTEEVINQLSSRITLEKNREAIFKEVVNVLDEVFELEEAMTIVAVRDENEVFSYYRISGKFQKIKNTDPLIQAVQAATTCLKLDDAPEKVRLRLEELQLHKCAHGVLLPFHSPEYLEGVIILCERSNQLPYSDSDIRFFNNLISFLAPVLYRLTPMEKLEELYNENRQKLHEAEIQLIRAQKIESIVHATRQCHHEIRTPLNIIRLGIGRIKSLEDLEAYKEVAREEIDHALDIVEETLTITEVDKTTETRAGDIDINDVIHRCLRLVDRTRYNVELDLAELPQIPAVFSDMQVVITNLIHNAIEAMPEGGGLAFTTRANATDVIITIEDSGEGIPEALRSRVWEPYFSGRGSDIGNSNAGRGWGLTIVNRIISAHQGTIRFTSEEKVGTRFIITLPRKKEQDDNARGGRLTQAYP
jgi:signal transduction histidine kinase